MVEESSLFLIEHQKLIFEKDELYRQLVEANEVIDSIKKGNIDAVFIANNDITKVLVSKTADQTYRRFIEIMSEGVVTLHTDGIILYSNSSFARIVNLPLENVIGVNIRDFIPIEFLEKSEQFLNDNPENNSKLELSITNDKGKRTHFIVSLNKLDLQDFVAINLVWTDLTIQKESEETLLVLNENLKAANIELATFAHIASHDLQEPLRKIVTYSSLLRSDYEKNIPQQGQDYLNKIQRASERMRNLIDDILEYSQLSKNEILFEPTNIQSIVSEILNDLEIVIKETKAKISREKELPIIEANSSQMRQLFQNLISNSLKFITANRIPEISITYEIKKGRVIMNFGKTTQAEDFCIFYIQDNGIGFDPEYIDKIFTIFQRLNRDSLYQGTGIGLAICKKIVEAHNGSISAFSKINEGSLFTVTIPLCQKRARTIAG